MLAQSQLDSLYLPGEDKTWTRGLWDPYFGPGPWTPCHGSDPWTLFSNNECQNIRFDKKLSTDARDCSQIFSCAYMTYILLANVQLQEC